MKNQAEKISPAPKSAGGAYGTDHHRRGFLGSTSIAILSATMALGRAEAQDIEKAAKAERDESESDVGPRK